jgi:hypothetical protein
MRYSAPRALSPDVFRNDEIKNMDKIDQAFFKRIDAAAATKNFRVIVTLTPKAKMDALDKADLQIDQRFDIIHAVAGSASGAVLKKLLKHPEVQLIEEDSEVRAIGH